jgi:hypothetical protein
LSSLPERREQIRLVQATFIRQVVELTQRPEERADIETLLTAAEQQGWSALVATLRRIAEGDRSSALLSGLDEEDRIIAESILRGLQDPSYLPDPRRA